MVLYAEKVAMMGPPTLQLPFYYISLWQRFCMPEILGGKWSKFILAFECLSRFWTKHATTHILYGSYVQNLKKVHLLHPEPLHSSRNTTEIWSLIITHMMMVQKRRWRAFDWYVLVCLTIFMSFPPISSALLLGFPVLYLLSLCQ